MSDEAAMPPAVPAISRRRLVLIDVLIGITTVLALVGMLSVWANRLLFNPDNWERTSTELLANPEIRSATSNYLVDQVYANVDVPGLVGSGLPPRLEPLAAPAAGALRNLAVQGTELALDRPRVQSLWASANRAADETFIAIVNGGKGSVGVNQGAVTLDLSAIVDNVATRLGLPADLGAKLPPSVAHLTVFRSDQLKYVQNGGRAVRHLALWLTILVPLLYALAIVLARGHRRRTLMTVGFAIVFAGVIAVAGRQVLENRIVDSLVANTAMRPAVRATVSIGTEMLGTIAGAFILVGAVVAAAAWLAGPARSASASRRALAPYLRDHPGPSFAVVTVIMVLVFIWDPIPATGTPVGIVVFLGLALLGTELLRRQTRREFPDARPGEVRDAMAARIRALRARRRTPAAPVPAGNGFTEQLERLAALRDAGSLTPDEYDTAKRRLLAGPDDRSAPAPPSRAAS